MTSSAWVSCATSSTHSSSLELEVGVGTDTSMATGVGTPGLRMAAGASAGPDAPFKVEKVTPVTRKQLRQVFETDLTLTTRRSGRTFATALTTEATAVSAQPSTA